MKLLHLTLISLLALSACKKQEPNSLKETRDFRQDMREFVISISKYAKTANPNFAIIPQNGIDLVTLSGESDGVLATDYLDAIDANGQEDLFYGYDNDDQASPIESINHLKSLLNVSKNAGKKILVTDYCSTNSKMNDSYVKNGKLDYTSFSANQRDLNNIPNFPVVINQQNNNNITKISDAKNFLYLINPVNFASKTDFINALKATNYDLVIMDLFFSDGNAFSASEISQLKTKVNGGKRMVICYMSIGEAEDYRYYWKNNWKNEKPIFLDAENPDWKGNYKVKYWLPEWQSIIYGNDESYLKKIVAAGFDGTYLDIIDGFEYYE